jgi:hypothetical protein
MAMFSVTLTGTEAVAAQIREQVQQVPKYVAAAMYQEALGIARSAQKLAPRALGNLANSAHVELPKIDGEQIEVQLGFGGTAGFGNVEGTNKDDVGYALYVHENPRAGKTGGMSPSGVKYPFDKWSRVGQWKYLEHPFLAAAKGMAERIAEKVRSWQATDVKA